MQFVSVSLSTSMDHSALFVLLEDDLDPDLELWRILSLDYHNKKYHINYLNEMEYYDPDHTIALVINHIKSFYICIAKNYKLQIFPLGFYKLFRCDTVCPYSHGFEIP